MSDKTLLDSCVEGAALGYMEPKERDNIDRMGRVAYDMLRCSGSIPDGVHFLAWLDDQVRQACERDGLYQARHEDYNYIRGHLARLMGNATTQQAANRRIPMEPGVRALAALRRECDDARDVIERPRHYVVKIAKARFKTSDVKRLDARQLWGLVMDIRRCAQRRRKGFEEKMKPGQPCLPALAQEGMP